MNKDPLNVEVCNQIQEFGYYRKKQRILNVSNGSVKTACLLKWFCKGFKRLNWFWLIFQGSYFHSTLIDKRSELQSYFIKHVRSVMCVFSQSVSVTACVFFRCFRLVLNVWEMVYCKGKDSKGRLFQPEDTRHSSIDTQSTQATHYAFVHSSIHL